MTTSLEHSPKSTVPAIGFDHIAPAYVLQLGALHHRRTNAALLFAQETMNNREDAAARSFADFYEASIEYQLLWSCATADAKKEA